jgi:succinoglycan biosynthesis transport protein ExoP
VLKRVENVGDWERVEADAEAKGVDFGEALRLLRRRWRFVLGVAALTLVIGALYVATETPLYVASAQLLLEPLRARAAGLDPTPNEVAMDVTQIESQIAILKSTSLLARVVRKERLFEDPEFGASAHARGLSSLLSTLFGPRDDADAGSTAAASDPPNLTATIERLRSALGVQRSGQSLVLLVSIASRDAVKAARLANAVADAFVVDKLDARFETAKRASVWLAERLTELKQKLRDSEEAVARFRAENNLVAFGGSLGVTLTEEQLAQLNGKLVAARTDAAERKARLDVLQKFLAGGGAAEDASDIANTGAIADLRRQENDLRRQEADLLARYNDRHPAVVDLRAQISDIRRNITAEASRLAIDVRHDWELALARQKAIEKTLGDVTGQNDVDAAKRIDLRELERNASADRALFEDFLQRSKVTEEQSSFEAREARIITPALAPSAPSYPNRGRVLLTALLIGLALGVGGAYGLEYLDAGFAAARQIEDTLRLPLIASIPHMDARELSFDGEARALADYLVARPQSALSETIRSLRSAVQMSDVDTPPKVLLATSTSPGEGKSALAQMLAASAAQSGLKALLIDADLRRRASSIALGLDERAGLVDYLIGDAELSAVVAHNQGRGHWTLPSGAATLNAPDLLASARFRAMIAALRSKFDVIVLDTPPMAPTVDALVAARCADKIIYVVRFALTSRELARETIARLPEPRRIVGVVLNQITTRPTNGAYVEAYESV